MTSRGATTNYVFGILAGGRGQRLGGVVKGSLRTPSGATILQGLTDVVNRVRPGAPIVLVGSSSLDAPGLPRLADDPPGRGPLGGLVALLRSAAEAEAEAVALASDLPQVSPELLERLLTEAPEAPLYAPKLDGIWQPLFARYSPSKVRPAVDAALVLPRAGLLSVFDRVDAREMLVDPAEERALIDWDEPADLPAELRRQLPGFLDE